MSWNSKMTCRSRWVIAAGVVVLFTLLGGGCGDFMPGKGAGVEATRIIKDLRKVETAPEPNIPLPQFFKAPPEIIEQTVGGKPEYKLFYFCRHHTSPEMQKIVDAQFASVLFDAKGKSTRKVDYTVSSNPATNQLIVRCPALEDAEGRLGVTALDKYLGTDGNPWKPLKLYIDDLTNGTYRYEGSLIEYALSHGTVKKREAVDLLEKAAKELKLMLHYYRLGDHEQATEHLVKMRSFWGPATLTEFLDDDLRLSK